MIEYSVEAWRKVTAAEVVAERYFRKDCQPPTISTSIGAEEPYDGLSVLREEAKTITNCAGLLRGMVIASSGCFG